MSGDDTESAARRAQTDTSLGAERAVADSAEWLAPKAQRVLDDLIERDRIAVDRELKSLRESTDSSVARERAASSARDSSVALEHDVTDAGKKAERAATDALLDHERRRADAMSASHLREHATDHARLVDRRGETDESLVTERIGADSTTESLLEARSSLKGRDAGLAMVAHDLRTPLSVISLNAELLVANAKDDVTRETAADVVCAAARMERMLIDLLDLARIEAGRFTLTKESHDVGALVRAVHHAYTPLFLARGMTLTVRTPAVAVVASFDRDRIVQVMSNLLGNALKFVPTGGIVDLEVERTAHDVEIRVTDSGPGIQSAALLHVFEQFYQRDNQSRRGLGLGLHICQNIVEAHGGRIWVESGDGKGARFHLTLPDDPPVGSTTLERRP